MANKNDNVVLNLNALEQGLNFLVPAEWWNDFVRQNENIRLCNDIVIPAQHPLDILIQMGIIQYQDFSYKKQLTSLKANAKKAAKNITNQVKGILSNHGQKNGIKNDKSAFNEWACLDLEASQVSNKTLVCPEVDFDLIKELLFDTFEWKVIKPSLYRLISQQNCKVNKERHSNQIIGIPIFLESIDVQDFKSQMTYNLERQIHAVIYFYNTAGSNYNIIGAIQTRQALPRMIQYLYLGLQKMTAEECFSIVNQSRRTIISIYQNSIYCNQKQKCLKLKWRPSEQLPKNVFSYSFEFIQFSSNCQFQRSAQKQDELFKYSCPSKKRKQNESEANKNSLSRTVKRKGFQPTSSNSYSPISKIYYNSATIKPIFKTNNILVGPPTNNEHHSSTQQQTPSAKLKQSSLHSLLHADYIKYQNLRKQQNRIKFPIWGSSMNVKSLLKFSQLKTNDLITVPFSNTNRLVSKRVNNKKIFLSGRCNKIHKNDQGQLIQEEAAQQQPQIFAIPNQIIKNLQSLAVEVVSNKTKIQIERLLKKEDMLEPAKQKVDIQSQTCKNQDLDELDSISSHQQ